MAGRDEKLPELEPVEPQEAERCDGTGLSEALKASEERYRSITQTSVDAIITTDSVGTVLTWNLGAELMFGFGQEILGRSVLAIIPERYRQQHLDGVERFLASGRRNLIGRVAELAALRSDGGEFAIELSLSTWQDGRGVCFGAIIRDISERKRVERLREDVQRMIRHDLKSPLVGVVGMAGLLLKADNLDPRQQKAAATIRELGQRLLGLIQRSRDIFQLEEGSYQLRAQPVDLAALSARVAAELEPLARARRVRFSRRRSGKALRAGQRYMVTGEESLLEVLFENLMKNAVEAAPAGSWVRVAMAADPAGGHRVEFHNLGVVPAEIRERFFEPYVTSGKREGTGLGTHSARLIARAHGGELTFTTSESQGTTLVLSLPAQAGPRQ